MGKGTRGTSSRAVRTRSPLRGLPDARRPSPRARAVGPGVFLNQRGDRLSVRSLGILQSAVRRMRPQARDAARAPALLRDHLLEGGTTPRRTGCWARVTLQHADLHARHPRSAPRGYFTAHHALAVRRESRTKRRRPRRDAVVLAGPAGPGRSTACCRCAIRSAWAAWRGGVRRRRRQHPSPPRGPWADPRPEPAGLGSARWLDTGACLGQIQGPRTGCPADCGKGQHHRSLGSGGSRPRRPVPHVPRRVSPRGDGTLRGRDRQAGPWERRRVGDGDHRGARRRTRPYRIPDRVHERGLGLPGRLPRRRRRTGPALRVVQDRARHPRRPEPRRPRHRAPVRRRVRSIRPHARPAGLLRDAARPNRPGLLRGGRGHRVRRGQDRRSLRRAGHQRVPVFAVERRWGGPVDRIPVRPARGWCSRTWWTSTRSTDIATIPRGTPGVSRRWIDGCPSCSRRRAATARACSSSPETTDAIPRISPRPTIPASTLRSWRPACPVPGRSIWARGAVS